MSDNLNIGKIIETEQRRDAVHFAIAPMLATETLYPGQRVGLEEGSDSTASIFRPAVGIVDPFLVDPVRKGQTFWLFLFPNTVTGMRHEWTHPAFGVKSEAKPKDSQIEASKQWIAEHADLFGMSYNAIIEAADGWQEYGDYHTLSFDTPSEAYDKAEEFWKHYEIVTGKKPKNAENFFTCAC